MKLKTFMFVLVGILVIASFMYPKLSAKTHIKGTSEAEAFNEEYSAVNSVLKGASAEGKEAGEVQMESQFENADSGGMEQQISDTVKAQNELESNRWED